MKEFFYSIAANQNKSLGAQLLKPLLWILSMLYLIGVRLTYWLYSIGICRRRKLAKPVISVGNLTLGGVGKTPLVSYLAQRLKGMNVKPVVLLRGYMDQSSHESSPMSDEASMLEDQLSDVPVLVGPNRFANAQNYLHQNDADVFLLDDGFQHWRLARDLDIVVMDTMNPWGNGALMPRGVLREPLSSLSRSDVIVLSKSNQGPVEQVKERLSSLNDEKLIVSSIHEPRTIIDLRTQKECELSKIRGEKICCLSSIGNPDSFEDLCKKLGADIHKSFVFMDHYIYSPQDLERINQYCLDNKVGILMTTHKDAVKLKNLLNNINHSITVYYLNIQVKIHHGEEQLLQRITDLVRR